MPQLVALLPWGHHRILLDRVKNYSTRQWYLKAAVEHGRSRNVLAHHISTALHKRQGKALKNFTKALPSPASDLAQQLLKNPYQFDFLILGPDARERELERELQEHLRDLLLELGRGFAFVGSQVPLEEDGQTFYIDLLFYHLRLERRSEAKSSANSIESARRRSEHVRIPRNSGLVENRDLHFGKHGGISKHLELRDRVLREAEP